MGAVAEGLENRNIEEVGWGGGSGEAGMDPTRMLAGGLTSQLLLS